MKKQRLSVLFVITFLFAGFTIGYLFGRNQEKHLIHISVSAASQTEAEASVPATQPIETIPAAQSVVPTVETTPVVVFPININTADKETIMALPGIGEVLAQRILAYRNDHGAFSSVEQLMNVKGIGEKRMEEILDYITIGG